MIVDPHHAKAGSDWITVNSLPRSLVIEGARSEPSTRVGDPFHSSQGKNTNPVKKVILHSSDKERWYNREQGRQRIYSLLLSNLLAVPRATGGADFSVGRSNVRFGEKNSRTPLRTSLSDFSSIILAIWSGLKELSRPRRYAAKPAT